MSEKQPTTTALYVFSCWLFGHDFFEDRRGRLYCVHRGKRA